MIQEDIVIGMVLVLGMLLIGVSMLYLTFRIVQRVVLKNKHIERHHLAFMIFVAGVLCSCTYLLSAAVQPTYTSVKLMMAYSDGGEFPFWRVVQQISFILGVCLVVILMVNLISLLTFTTLTRKINEFKEIRENNVVVALLTAVVLICMSILTHDGLEILLGAMNLYSAPIPVY